MKSPFKILIIVVCALLTGQQAFSQDQITSPKEQFGINIGDNYNLITYSKMLEYWKIIASESPRMVLEDIGVTAEGRRQVMAIITSPENHADLHKYKDISAKLALAKDISEEEAAELARIGKAVIWIDGGLHATEVVGSHQLMEMVYQMVSLNDEETLRFLKDLIILAVPANPDGLELVSGWYMRNSKEEDRSTSRLPRLYQKYIGHDNNRDSYMATQPETENMARIMYRQWFPQIMYNHHQSGPSDIIVFVPPFRDPPNYWYDPILITQIQSVGLAMHSRLISEGKGGSGMRSRSNYSTWFNGNLRTTGYFHNQIGILTEIKGNPTPYTLSFFPDRQLPSNDMPLPHTPRVFLFREAIEYSITMNRAILDYASRNREVVLMNRYRMGKNHIDKGSRDNWTVHPDIVDMVNSSVKKDAENSDAFNQTFRRRGRGVDAKYMDLFRIPENRDPRGYILPSDQEDFATATKFVNTFIKNGITVHKASSDFEVGGKKYPKGSYIFKTDQAFRPHIMDLFEPQDHPDDFLFEGGPPIPPYDNAGYTLAFQMGIEFDRILDGFDGPFEEISDVEGPMPGKVIGSSDPGGFLLSHKTNNSTIAVNRLLASKHKVYWTKSNINEGGNEYPEGTIYIESKKGTEALVNTLSQELGIDFIGINNKAVGNDLKINPVRIGLWDRYGGSMPSGWTRWLLEQYEFPFELVFPQELDQGNLNKKFDVLVFVTGAIPAGQRRSANSTANLESIPEEYRSWIGSVSSDKTIPELLKFVENGGSIIAIGSSTNIAGHAGLPIKNHIVDKDGEGLSSEDYFVPSSILNVRVNNKLPIAYGMNEHVDIFFSNSPVFRFNPDADKQGVTPIAWFDSDRPLRSGWAWGQDRLYGGVAMAEAKYGKGKMYLFGPEILFRAQPHGTFKLFFNGLYLSNTE
ncbi:MAG: M14 family zinc carboxypeptidase [Bacteroidales bacterium]|nr:M14 family zinc carboxypeptidase [Bacteroidales bacterium]